MAVNCIYLLQTISSQDIIVLSSLLTVTSFGEDGNLNNDYWKSGDLYKCL